MMEKPWKCTSPCIRGSLAACVVAYCITSVCQPSGRSVGAKGYGRSHPDARQFTRNCGFYGRMVVLGDETFQTIPRDVPDRGGVLFRLFYQAGDGYPGDDAIPENI